MRKLSSDGDTLKRFRSELMWKHTEQWQHTHTNTDTLIYTHLFSLHQGSGRLSLLPALIGSRLSGTDGRSVLRLTRALPHHRINNLFSMSDDNNELLRSRGLSAATRGVWSSYFVWKLLNDKTEQKFKLKWTWEATEEQNGECKHTFCFWKTGHNKKAQKCQNAALFSFFAL